MVPWGCLGVNKGMKWINYRGIEMNGIKLSITILFGCFKRKNGEMNGNELFYYNITNIPSFYKK